MNSEEEEWAEGGGATGGAATHPQPFPVGEETRVSPLDLLAGHIAALRMEQATMLANSQQAQALWDQQMQALQTTLAQLVAVQPPPLPLGIVPAPVAPEVPVHPEPMQPMALTPLPTRFGGDPQDYQQFVLKCQMHFDARPTHFDTDAKKVRFMTLLMEGSAFKWVAPYLARRDPILLNLDDFLQHFGTVFEKQYHAQSRRQEFLGLQQGARDVITYVAEFQSLAAEEEWSEVARISLLHKGLNEELKDILMMIEPLPVTMNAYIGLVLRMEHRLGERKKNQTLALASRPVSIRPEVPTTQDSEVPMEIGALRSPMSRKERDRRRLARLCYFCGKAGHMIRQCPTRPSAGNALAAQEGGS